MAVCGRILHFATSSILDAKFRVSAKDGTNHSIQEAFQRFASQPDFPSRVHLSITQKSRPEAQTITPELSLFFLSTDSTKCRTNRYRILFEAAKFASRNGSPDD
jgi:hypothetical protein